MTPEGIFNIPDDITESNLFLTENLIGFVSWLGEKFKLSQNEALLLAAYIIDSLPESLVFTSGGIKAVERLIEEMRE